MECIVELYVCICVWIVSEYKDIQGLCQAQVQVVDVVIVIVMFVVHLAILKVRGMISQVIKLKPSCVFRLSLIHI